MLILVMTMMIAVVMMMIAMMMMMMLMIAMLKIMMVMMTCHHTPMTQQGDVETVGILADLPLNISICAEHKMMLRAKLIMYLAISHPKVCEFTTKSPPISCMT